MSGSLASSRAKRLAARSPVLSPTHRRPWSAFWIVAGLLFVAKLYVVFLVGDLPLLGDERRYWINSAQFFGTYFDRPDFWAPLQTAFLATLRIFFADQAIYAARIIQLIVHTLTGAAIFLIGRNLGGRRVGFVASVLFLTLPETVSMAYLLFSETWSMFWFFGATYIYFTALGGAAYAQIGLAGFGFGMAAMFRSINLYFLPFLLLHFWIFDEAPRNRRLLRIIVLMVGVCLPISIQTAKNYRVFGEFVPIDTCGADNIWKAHNTFSPRVWEYGLERRFVEARDRGFPGARPRVRHLPPASRQLAEMRNAIAFVADNPALTVKRTLSKIRVLFYPALFAYRNFANRHAGEFVKTYLDTAEFRGASSVSYVIMMMLAVAGLVFCPEKRIRSFCLLLVCYHVAVNGFFAGSSRYRLAFAPMLVVFTAWAGCNWREIWTGARSGRGLVVLFFWGVMLANWAPQLIRIIPPR